jgi:hypothetical protein
MGVRFPQGSDTPRGSFTASPLVFLMAVFWQLRQQPVNKRPLRHEYGQQSSRTDITAYGIRRRQIQTLP